MISKLRSWLTPRRRTAGNILFLVWLGLFMQMHTSIAAPSFAEDVLAYDVHSLLLAAGMALFGGTLRTIFTLAADNKVVVSMVRESWKDILVAIVAGFLVYITLEAFRAMSLFPIPSEVRFAAIVFAGWSRLSFFGWLNRLGIQTTNAVTDAVTSRIAILGSAKKAAESPPPAPVPSPDKPKPFANKPFREVA